MIIDLSNFPEDSNQPINFQGALDGLESEMKERDVILVGPIKYEGMILNLHGKKSIEMSITFNYEEKCSRCLEPSVHKMETTLSGELVRGQEDELKDNESETDDEETPYDDTFYYEKDNLDLREYILNQVILSLPMKSLCDKDCKGLCASCGIDLNKSSCECTHDEIDPRLAKLKNFFPEK